MIEISQYTQPFINEVHAAQEAASAKASVHADLERQCADARSEATDAIAHAEELHVTAQRVLFALASKGKDRISGDELAQYAGEVFKLNGKSDEAAERQAGLLGGIASSETVVPVLLGADRIQFCGGDSGATLFAKNSDMPGQISIGTLGRTEAFSRPTAKSSWQWAQGMAVGMGPVPKDTIISDDRDEVIEAIASNSPVVGIGLEAVLAGLDYGSSKEINEKHAIKFVIAKKIGDLALLSSVDQQRLVEGYKATLRHDLLCGRIREGVPINPKIHPEISELVKKLDPSYSRSNHIADILEDDLHEHGSSSRLGRLSVEPVQRSRKAQIADNIVYDVSQLLATYAAVLTPTNGEISWPDVIRLSKKLAAFKRQRILDFGNGNRFSSDVKALKRLENHVDMNLIIDFMYSREFGGSLG